MTQKARLAAWMLMQRLQAGVELPLNWNALDDRQMADLVIILTDARQDGINLFAEQVQVGIDYSAVNARAARRAREYAGELIKGIDRTTAQSVKDVIAMFAETPGMTMQDVIDRLPFDAQRARMIAVTEITRAYAEGELEAGIELRKRYPDVQVVKTWFTNNDEKVCPICEPLDGKDVPHDEGWGEGGNPDPEGIPAPPAHPNCRCWMQTSTRIV